MHNDLKIKYSLKPSYELDIFFHYTTHSSIIFAYNTPKIEKNQCSGKTTPKPNSKAFLYEKINANNLYSTENYIKNV